MTGEQTERVKIIIAEDHKTVRKLIQISLRQDGRFDVIAETGNGLEALEMVGRLQPDVLVVDIRLPGMEGIEVTRRTRADYPSTRVVVMSMHDDDAHIYSALASGAGGYVVKSQIDGLADAIETVSRGEIYLTPPISLTRIETYRQKTNKPPLEILTPSS